MKYLYHNILGSFVFDQNLNIITQIEIGKESDLSKREEKLSKYHPIQLPENKLNQVLEIFKKKEYYSSFYELNLKKTKLDVKNSVSEDLLIIQTISNINEIDKVINLLTKRIKEWYGLYFPELERTINHQEKFIELILQKNKSELIKELNIQNSMGAELKELHLQEIKILAQEISHLFELRKKHELYLEKIMKNFCPNLLELAGTTIAARLLELGKSLKNLALLPASTIQLLGAEKALFRHLKTGSRSPKYGVIINHPIVQKAKKEDKGKAARMLADKLSLCARLDYFKGEFKAKEYFKELQSKLL